VDRDSIRPALLAVVLGLAVVLTAATIAAPTGGGTGVGGADSDVGLRDGDGGILGGGFGSGEGNAVIPLSVLCPNGQFSWQSIAVFALGLVGVAVFARRQATLVESLMMAALALVPIAFLVLLAVMACTDQRGDAAGGGGLLGGLPSSGGSGLSDAVGALTSSQLAAAVLLAALALAALGALLTYLVSGDDETEEESWTVPERDPAPDVEYDLDAIGDAAGRAADRLDAPDDMTNEIYHAWLEMTRHLAVDRPRSSTPTEFADAAVDAGMAREDVRELTDLFELVRYGGEDPTPERVDRARDALRRIERTYGGEGR
jgi:hypothetical protein